MQTDAEPSGAHPGKVTVDPLLGIIEPAAGCDGQPLRQPADRSFIGEADIAAGQTVPVVNPYLIRRGDEHIGCRVSSE